MENIESIYLEKVNAEQVVQEPFPHFSIDNILEEAFAEEIYSAFPSYQEAKSIGHEFAAVNEKRKIQITDYKKFPAPILALHQILASKVFIEKVEAMTGIPNLIPDPGLAGGGIHETNAGGHLDVHVDFNYNPKTQLHRRVNILFYFNKGWKESYGGYLDIWDKNVKRRFGYFEPKFNRACGFATSEHSWHGVTPVTCPPEIMRKSFAVYYYTKEAPKDWDGKQHSTIFKARPEEWVKGNVAMPVENVVRSAKETISNIKSSIKSIIK